MIRALAIFLLLLAFSAPAQDVDLSIQKGHSDAIDLLEFSDKGTYLASVSVHNEVILWDVQLSKMLSVFNINEKEKIEGAKFTADEKTLKIKTNFQIYHFDIDRALLKRQIDADTAFRDKTYYFDSEEGTETFLADGAVKKKRKGKRFKKYKFAVNYLNAPFMALDVHKEKNLVIGVAADEKIYIHNYKSGGRMHVLSGHNSEIHDVRFSKDGRFFATAGKDRSIIIWRTRDFKIEKRLRSNVFQKKTATFSQDGNRIYVGDELGFIYAIDLSAVFPVISVTRPNLHSVNRIIKSPDGKGYYIASSNNYLYYKENLSKQKPKIKYQFRQHAAFKAKQLLLQEGFDVYQDPFGEVEVVSFSPNQKRVIFTGKSDLPNVALVDLEKEKTRHYYNYDDNRKWENWSDLCWLNDTMFVSVLDSSKTLYVWDVTHKKKTRVRQDTLPFLINNIEPIDGETLWITSEINGQYTYSIRTRNLRRQCDVEGDALWQHGVYMLIANTQNELVVWDRAANDVYHKFKGHSEQITDVSFHPTKDLFLTSSDDGTIKLWSFKNKSLIVTIIPFRNEEFVFVTQDNYYLITKGALEEIGFKKEGKFFYPEQFDLKYNRPDIVLREMGFTNEDLLSAYYKAYQKRLKKLNFTEEQLSAEFELPEASITNIKSLPTTTPQSVIELDLKFFDRKYELDRINIYVNDVAVRGKNGIDLRAQHVKEYEGKIKINLAAGSNKIEISVLNQKGVESYKQTVEIESTVSAKKPSLFLVTIGVSKFKDSRYNLDYAAKDAKDLSTLFGSNPYFSEVKSKTYTDEEVTLDKLAEISTFLEGAGINDVVLIFVAGHGVLDDNFDYYFASHDMDFLNPSERGIPYESVEGLLDGIAALKKLLFLDTCHSGEVDKDDLESAPAQDDPENGDLNFRSAGINVRYADGEGDDGKFGLKSINELMKTVFSDLRRGTGATVISSSGGEELSIESGEYNNGLFTYCVINGLENKLADLNKDNHIDLSELQRYVRDEVVRLSEGKQTPTSRITNDELDYRLW